MNNMIYLIFGSILVNFLLIVYFLVFGKHSWFQLKSRFMKNPLRINIINSSGKIRSYLLNSSNENVKCPDGKTRHTPDNMKLFDSGIANFYYNEDDSEPLSMTDLAMGGINPDYLTQLLLQAEINGANSFIKNLVKVNIFIIVLGIMALLLFVVVWKIFEIEAAIQILNNLLTTMNATSIRV